MKPFALGIFEDLKRRRLLPVAAFLIIALVAVPVLMLKGEEPVPPATPVAGAPVSADGLPDPAEALGQSKPLVTLQVLQNPSNLEAYASKNPFKPLENVSGTGGDGAANALTDAQAAADGAGSSTGGSDASSGGGGGSSTPTTGGGGTSTPTPVQSPTTTTTTPKSDDSDDSKDDTKTPEKLTYALDLTYAGPRGLKSYKNVAKLRMFPSESQPLFVYLGVDTTGTKAVFLVDSSLTFSDGEGSCSPDRTACATVSLQPGEIATFTTQDNQAHQLTVDQIRTVSAKAAAASARRSARRARASASAIAADGTPRPKPRRFMPPVITDLFTGTPR